MSGLTLRPYNTLLQLCDAVTGCRNTRRVTVRPPR